MSGVIVIANRATAARDILSGTIHKLTLWFDDVRRKPDMKMFLKEAVGRWDSGYGTERRLTKKGPLSLTVQRMFSQSNARDGRRSHERNREENSDRSTGGAQEPIN